MSPLSIYKEITIVYWLVMLKVYKDVLLGTSVVLTTSFHLPYQRVISSGLHSVFSHMR